MLPNIHLLGIQGSGKGTQSALLVKRFGLSYLPSGDLFRQRAAEGDAFGKEIADLLSKGTLLPTEYLVKTVAGYLAAHPIERGLLGDGVIRKVEHYHRLAPLWESRGLGEPLLIHLLLTEDIALERIKKREAEKQQPQRREHYLVYGGKLLKRTDDNPRAIHERFRLFHELTEPVIGLFKEKGACLTVDADRPVEAIHAEIAQALTARYPVLADVPD